jgi:hypothetical protein
MKRKLAVDKLALPELCKLKIVNRLSGGTIIAKKALKK